MKISRQRMGQFMVALLLISGTGLLVKGLGLEVRPDVVDSSVSTARPSPSPLPAVRPGSGVYTSDAPTVSSEVKPTALCPGCDVVLITVCSLRKDYLGAYGHPGGLSPHIDGIAKNGVRFERAYAASNFTLASLTGVLTGRYGSATGVTGWDKGLTADVPTLPEILGVYGYRTAAFTTDAPSGFRPDYGLDRGFQHMEITPPPRNSPDGRFRGGSKEPAGTAAQTATSWLGAQPSDAPVFLMFHTRTAHFPFVVDPPEEGADPTGMRQLLWEAGQTEAAARPDQAMPGMAGGTAQEGIVEIQREDPLQTAVNRMGDPAVEVWKEAYAEGVALMDKDVEAMMAAVSLRGRPTVVILVADHGESLNDHGELLHGDAFFDGVVNVPLLISVPGIGQKGSSRSALVSQVDIVPTVLDLVGAVSPAGIDGVSLTGVLKGEDQSPHVLVLSEGGVARQEGDKLPGAVIDQDWVLLKQRRGCGSAGSGLMDQGMPVCLYNASGDPNQMRNVASSNRTVVDSMLERWRGYRSAHGRIGQSRELSPAFIEELQRSGYDFSTGAP